MASASLDGPTLARGAPVGPQPWAGTGAASIDPAQPGWRAGNGGCSSLTAITTLTREEAPRSSCSPRPHATSAPRTAARWTTTLRHGRSRSNDQSRPQPFGGLGCPDPGPHIFGSAHNTYPLSLGAANFWPPPVRDRPQRPT